MIQLRVHGTPGPKGSVNAFCVRCAKRRLKQTVVIKEESDNGVAFRKTLAAALRPLRPEVPYAGPVGTALTIWIPRRRKVVKGVEIDEWVPSHAGPFPIHQQSGDAEKHVRNLHDAMQDARIITDDSIVVEQQSFKRWATDEQAPGVGIHIYAVKDPGDL